MKKIAIKLEPFCFKQFDPKSSSYIPFDKQSFEDKLNALYDPKLLKDGYAPFCKHIFVQNFTDAVVSTLRITADNQHLLKTVYEARTEKQLPVLKRYFPKDKIQLVKAKFLDIILYSREQVQKQNQAMKNQDPYPGVEYDYAVVSIKPQDQQEQNPMDPITMFRNALGKQEGGSGIPLDKNKYLESVKFWTDHALIK